MPILYELAVLGAPSAQQLAALRDEVAKRLALFELELDRDVAWHTHTNEFRPDPQRAAAAVYFGEVGAVAPAIDPSVPVIPLASSLRNVGAEIPVSLRALNCLGLDETSLERVASTMLECAGLMPRQRRVFLSYRRDEARQAALQLFDVLSARQFDVFLDTHGVPPAVDFQATLWHRLCESDVLVMLDTQTYFASRWTSAEFGRALAKGVGVLRVGWPDATPSIRTGTVSRVELVADEIEAATGKLADPAVTRICDQLEQVRSQSLAVRRLNLVGNVRQGIAKIGGQFLGMGARNAIHIELPDGRPLTVFPALGVPSSLDLHEASNGARDRTAVVYDAVGLLPAWQAHLDWLGQSIRSAQWMKSAEVAWHLADWEPGP